MKDAQSGPAYGRTNWRRFAVAVGVPTVVAGALIVGVANGALAASFAVSGQSFKIKATELRGTGFAQYGSFVATKDGKQIPVAMSGISSAQLDNLCQSVVVPGTTISLTINAGGGGRAAAAENMMIGVSELSGDATFKNITIGQDASTLTAGGAEAHGRAGLFGQQADSVTITDLKQTAYSTTAGKFTLNGLNLKVNLGKDGKPVECYAD